MAIYSLKELLNKIQTCTAMLKYVVKDKYSIMFQYTSMLMVIAAVIDTSLSICNATVIRVYGDDADAISEYRHCYAHNDSIIELNKCYNDVVKILDKIIIPHEGLQKFVTELRKEINL